MAVFWHLSMLLMQLRSQVMLVLHSVRHLLDACYLLQNGSNVHRTLQEISSHVYTAVSDAVAVAQFP